MARFVSPVRVLYSVRVPYSVRSTGWMGGNHIIQSCRHRTHDTGVTSPFSPCRPRYSQYSNQYCPRASEKTRRIRKRQEARACYARIDMVVKRVARKVGMREKRGGMTAMSRSVYIKVNGQCRAGDIGRFHLNRLGLGGEGKGTSWPRVPRIGDGWILR